MTEERRENIENTKENNIKKQKAGLNAVRPDETTETKFKQLAEDNNISQTKMFERIFWHYVRDIRKQNREDILSFESEINLIDNDLKNILQHFKSITEKAQDTAISLKNNGDQSIKNLNLEIDTLKNRILEIEKRNSELEQSNAIFTEVKSSLESQISTLNDELLKKDSELKELEILVKNKDKEIKDLARQLSAEEKEKAIIMKENSESIEKFNSCEVKMKALEITNSSLKSTIDNIENLKKAEIDSIRANYNNKFSELENKLNTYNENKEKEIKAVENNLRIAMEADKKLAIADLRLELADAKTKYADVLTEINALKSNNKHVSAK